MKVMAVVVASLLQVLPTPGGNLVMYWPKRYYFECKISDTPMSPTSQLRRRSFRWTMHECKPLQLPAESAAWSQLQPNPLFSSGWLLLSCL